MKKDRNQDGTLFDRIGGRKLNARSLVPEIDLRGLTFKDTSELSVASLPLGQERAIRSLQFGLEMDSSGFNIFVSGAPGTGRTTWVKEIVQNEAKVRAVPQDLCFVNNFKDPSQPHYLFLRPGLAIELRDQMAKMVEDLKIAIPRIFESSEYIETKSKLIEEREELRSKMFGELGGKAKERGIELRVGQMGISMTPMRGGAPLSDEEIDALPETDREKIFQKLKDFQRTIREFHISSHQLDLKYNERFRELDEQNIQQLLEVSLARLRETFEGDGGVQTYLDEVAKDIVIHFGDFLPSERAAKKFQALVASMNGLRRYQVNVVVNNEEGQGAPVIEETFPTYANLVGRVERRFQLGLAYSDFNDIRCGSLLKANGGYLILHVNDLFRYPLAWEALKRSLKSRVLLLEEASEYFGFSTVAIKPNPIPLNVKVILIGSPRNHYVLHQFEEDFPKIFKVKCEFAEDVNRGAEEVATFAKFVARLCKNEKLLPVTPKSIGLLLVHAARESDHRARISLQVQFLNDLVRESNYWAKKAGHQQILESDIEGAIEVRRERVRLTYERWLREFHEGTFLLDLKGSVVGQINALSVHNVGDFSFGRPCRVTARTFSGGKGVVDIQREANLSGSVHSKGVLILSGFLSGKFGQMTAVGISATLTFEQVYLEVEGDSASAAELVCILSSLADAPIRQDVAITGSVNQLGEIQPIGGVNEKIEGFFDICMQKGLTGTQGVIIPERNVKNLVLKREVVEAVERSEFSIYSVSTIDEALEILTGVPAGAPLYGGEYLEGTIYYQAQQRIIDLSEITFRRTMIDEVAQT